MNKIDKEIDGITTLYNLRVAQFNDCLTKKLGINMILCFISIGIFYFFIIEENNLFHIKLSFFQAFLFSMIPLVVVLKINSAVKKDRRNIRGLSEYIQSLEWLKTRTPEQQVALMELKNNK